MNDTIICSDISKKIILRDISMNSIFENELYEKLSSLCSNNGGVITKSIINIVKKIISGIHIICCKMKYILLSFHITKQFDGIYVKIH